MSHSAPSGLHPRLRRTLNNWTSAWIRVGEQTRFYSNTVGAMGSAVASYRGEVARLIAQMSLGTGALAVIGGTVVIIGFLTLSAGALIAVQGYNSLAGIGVEALTGFISRIASFTNSRFVSTNAWRNCSSLQETRRFFAPPER